MDIYLLFYTLVEMKEMFDHLGWDEYNQKETCKILFRLLVGTWLWGNLWVLIGSMDEPILMFLVLVWSLPMMFNSVKL